MSKIKITWLFLCCFLLFFFIGCTVAEFYPEEGEWYCEELQLQLSFDGQGDCYYIVGDEKVKCACGSDRGSRWLTVGCQEADSKYFDLGEEVFSAEFVRLDQEKLVVCEKKTETEYIFYRVG